VNFIPLLVSLLEFSHIPVGWLSILFRFTGLVEYAVESEALDVLVRNSEVGDIGLGLVNKL